MHEEEEIIAAAAIEGIMNLLKAEASPDVSTSTTANISASRGQLASKGKAKEAIGVQLSHQRVIRLTD